MLGYLLAWRVFSDHDLMTAKVDIISTVRARPINSKRNLKISYSNSKASNNAQIYGIVNPNPIRFFFKHAHSLAFLRRVICI